jgi:hypothetical protein
MECCQSKIAQHTASQQPPFSKRTVAQQTIDQSTHPVPVSFDSQAAHELTLVVSTQSLSTTTLVLSWSMNCSQSAAILAAMSG